MDCRELEDRLEALLDGQLSAAERRRCSRHLERCPSCRQLAQPLLAATQEPGDPADSEDLIDAVLARTSGAACRRAEVLLCGWLDDELSSMDRELMAGHLGRCADCRALAAAVSRLAVDLPQLAELQPDPGFVAAVLAATLPVRVRLRRWWAAVWPQWVHRPRFASEAAFVGTLALFLVFATPGSPLEAVPTKALVLVRTDPGAQLEAPVGAFERRFKVSVKEPLGVRYARGEAQARAWIGALEERCRSLTEEIGSRLGTSRELIASLIGSADKKATQEDADASNKE